MGKTSTLLGALLLSASGLTLHAQEQLYLTPVTSAEGLVDGQQYVLKYTGPGTPANVLLYEEASHTCVNNNNWQSAEWNAKSLLGENPGIIRRQTEGSAETPSLTSNNGQYIFTLEAGSDGTFAIKAASGNYVDGRDLQEVTSGKGVPVHSVNATVNKSYFTFTWNSNYWNIGNGATSGRNYLNVGGVDNGCATMWNNAGGNDKGRFQLFAVSDEAMSTVTFNYVDQNGNTIAPATTATIPMDESYTVPDAPEIAHFTGGKPDRTTIANPGAQETVTYTYTLIPPFTVSTVNGSSWTGGETWLALFTGGAYWVYNAGTDKVDLKQDVLTFDDTSLWCITGSETTGFTLYNKAAGANRPLFNDSGTSITLADPNSESTGTPLQLVYHEGGWYFKVQGTDNGYLNKLQGNNGPKEMGIWNSSYGLGDANSVVTFTDILPYYASLQAECLATAGYVGGYPTEAVASSGLASATTVDAYNTAFTALNAAEVITIQPGQYYRIVNELRKVGGKPIALTGGNASGSVGLGTATSAQNAGQLWQFEASGDGYKLRNANYGLYAGTLDGSGNNNVHMPLVDADVAPTYNLTALGGACWKLADPNNSAHNGVMHCAPNNNYIVAWNDGKGSASSWYIVPVTDIEVAMHSVDADATDTWATLCLPFAVETPDGLTAYTGQADTQAGTVALTEIEDGLVPAGNGVVLKGSAEIYTLAIQPDAEARTLEGNDLSGTTTAQPLSEAGTVYVLGKNNGTAGFYLPNEAQTELTANKAYLGGTPTQALAAGYRFVLGDDETTGIGSVQTPDGPTADQPCYDLQGRRVGQPRQGGVYIQGGKKVYIRK